MQRKLIFILITIFILLFSIPAYAQVLSYNQVKAKGYPLSVDSKTHQVFLLIDNLTSDYLICNIYIFGNFFIDFSQMEYIRIIYKDEFSKSYIQFASYNKYYDQKQTYQYCENFKIQINIDDFNKIIDKKNDIIYFQFTGKYATINAKMDKNLIKQFEKLSNDEISENEKIYYNVRPYSVFLVFYPINIYYSYNNNDQIIDDYVFSLLFENILGSGNFNFELGLYFKLPIFSGISFYFNQNTIFDFKNNFEYIMLFGAKFYFTIFDYPEIIFLRLNIFTGAISVSINSYELSKFLFAYYGSLSIGFPISTSYEYLFNIIFGKVENSNITLLIQFGIVFNLF